MATNAMPNHVRVGGPFGVVAILGGLFYQYHKREAAPMPFAPESFPGVEVTTVGSTSARLTPTTTHMPSMCTNDLAPTWEHCTTSPVPSPVPSLSAAEASSHASAYVYYGINFATVLDILRDHSLAIAIAIIDAAFYSLNKALPSRFRHAVQVAKTKTPLLALLRGPILEFLGESGLGYPQFLYVALEWLLIYSYAAILLQRHGKAWARRDDQQGRIQELERQLKQADTRFSKLEAECDNHNAWVRYREGQICYEEARLERKEKELDAKYQQQFDDMDKDFDEANRDREERVLAKQKVLDRKIRCEIFRRGRIYENLTREVKFLRRENLHIMEKRKLEENAHESRIETLKSTHQAEKKHLEDVLSQERSRTASEEAALTSQQQQQISRLQADIDKLQIKVQKRDDELDEKADEFNWLENECDEKLETAFDGLRNSLLLTGQGEKQSMETASLYYQGQGRLLPCYRMITHADIAAERQKLEKAEVAFKAELETVKQASKANLKKIYEGLRDSLIATEHGNPVDDEATLNFFQNQCELPKCWRLVTYKEVGELHTALRTVYDDIDASLFPLEYQEAPPDAESWRSFRTNGKLPECYTMVTYADIMAEREKCFKLFSKSLKAQPEEKQQIQREFLENGELPPQAEIAEGHLPQQAQPTLAMSTMHTAISVAPVDDTSANLAISTMQTVFSEAPVAHEVEDTEAHSAVPKMQILYPYMPVAQEADNTEADSHLQIPKPRHVSTTETVAPAQNPFLQDAASQKSMSTAQRFHFARTGGKIPAFGTIKFGAGQDKAFDFTKPTSHTFTDKTLDWEHRHGLLANRDEVKVLRPSVKTKRRTEQGSVRPTDDTGGRTLNLDKKRAEPAKFNSTDGDYMNDALQSQIAKFLKSEDIAKEEVGTPKEALAPEKDPAPEEDLAPEQALAPKVCYYEKGKPCQSADCVGDPEKYDENGCWIHEPGNETKRYGGTGESNENNRRRRAKGKQLCCDCYKKSLEDRSS